VLNVFPSLFGGARNIFLSSIVSVSRGTAGLQYIMKSMYVSSKLSSVVSLVGRLRRGEGNPWLFGVKADGRHLIGLGTEVIVNPDLGNIETPSVLQVLGPLLAVVKQVAELMPIQ
jgi:hypothetical protein